MVHNAVSNCKMANLYFYGYQLFLTKISWKVLLLYVGTNQSYKNEIKYIDINIIIH